MVFQTKNFLHLFEKLISYTFAENLKRFILDMFYFKKLRGVLTKNISHYLFEKYSYFSIFCNIYFNTELAFVFHLLGNFYIVCHHVVTCYFSLLQKDLDTFHKLFYLKPFFVFCIIIS